MNDLRRIKTFVRETLGCNCPEEVFQSIDCRTGVWLDRRVKLDASITVGNRLLIYVVGASIQGEVRQHLPFLVSAGKKERDTRGLNRFRLVVVCDDAVERKELRDSFEKMTAGDEKIHLHVISEQDSLFPKDNRNGPDSSRAPAG